MVDTASITVQAASVDASDLDGDSGSDVLVVNTDDSSRRTT
jgi:hypothetical protein